MIANGEYFSIIRGDETCTAQHLLKTLCVAVVNAAKAKSTAQSTADVIFLFIFLLFVIYV